MSKYLHRKSLDAIANGWDEFQGFFKTDPGMPMEHGEGQKKILNLLLEIMQVSEDAEVDVADVMVEMVAISRSRTLAEEADRRYRDRMIQFNTDVVSHSC